MPSNVRPTLLRKAPPPDAAPAAVGEAAPAPATPGKSAPRPRVQAKQAASTAPITYRMEADDLAAYKAWCLRLNLQPGITAGRILRWYTETYPEG